MTTSSVTGNEEKGNWKRKKKLWRNVKKIQIRVLGS